MVKPAMWKVALIAAAARRAKNLRRNAELSPVADVQAARQSMALSKADDIWAETSRCGDVRNADYRSPMARWRAKAAHPFAGAAAMQTVPTLICRFAAVRIDDVTAGGYRARWRNLARYLEGQRVASDFRGDDARLRCNVNDD